MDKLAKQLRDDAGNIECRVSDELDRRILASLEATQPDVQAAQPRIARSPRFWWASSLTGVAAALLGHLVLQLL